VALALANSRRTLPRETVEDLQTVEDLRRWLHLHGLEVRTSPLATAQLRQLLTLRDFVRELLTARVEDRRPSADAVNAINTAARNAPTAPQLNWNTNRAPQVHAQHETPDGFTAALAAIASDTIDLIAGERHHQLRACNAPRCVRFLLADHPRRRWCSKRCGDRVRAAHYYERTRTAPDA
jgi:predicted RNA-binding Zn ribbon-like protein